MDRSARRLPVVIIGHVCDSERHSVDSSISRLQMATRARALRGGPQPAAERGDVLEQSVRFQCWYHDDFVGAVLGDLSSRRGQCSAFRQNGATVIKAGCLRSS